MAKQTSSTGWFDDSSKCFGERAVRSLGLDARRADRFLLTDTAADAYALAARRHLTGSISPALISDDEALDEGGNGRSRITELGYAIVCARLRDGGLAPARRQPRSTSRVLSINRVPG